MKVLRNLVMVMSLAGLVFLSGCISVPPAVQGRQSLSAVCRQAGADLVFDPVVLSAKVARNGQTAHLLVGSNVVMIGQERIFLNAPVVRERGELYVPDDFKEKVLCRIDKTLCLERIRRGTLKIVIDPGHGGKDPGAVGWQGLKEKDVVLDIAKRLERILERRGYQVRLTRSRDIFISLEERTKRATEWGADLFISIHANASPSRSAHGFEVWATRALTHEDFAETQRKENHRILFSQLNMERHNRALEKTLEELCYSYKYAQSQELAEAVCKSCTLSKSQKNRGVKQSGFFVLRNTLVPSVLVEVGFISNSREAGRLRTSACRQDIAEMVAEGVRDYVRGL